MANNKITAGFIVGLLLSAACAANPGNTRYENKLTDQTRDLISKQGYAKWSREVIITNTVKYSFIGVLFRGKSNNLIIKT